MSMKKTLDQLKTILTEEQFSAFTSSIRELVETRADEKVQALLEEERVVFKAQLQAKAEEWLTLAVEEKEHNFKKLLQEAREEYDSRLVEEVKAIEARVIKTMDRVLEEEVDTALPNDIRLNAAKAQVYGEIVNRTIGVLEEQAIAINPNNAYYKVIEENKQLASELASVKDQVSTLASDKNRLQTRLFIEHKTSHLPDREREQVLALYKGASLEDVKARIEDTIEVLEESRRSAVRRPARVAGRDHQGDIHPGVSTKNQDAEKLLEEENQRNAARAKGVPEPEVAEEHRDILTTGAPNLLMAIDSFLDD